MGNKLQACKEMVNSLKLKMIKKKVKSNGKDDFIIKYVKNNKRNDGTVNINALDKRRIVFVSLVGLYQTWKQCPSVVLHSSILVMPLQRQWVYHPSRYQRQIQAHFLSDLSLFSDIVEREEFMELLRWKDSQGLVFWMFDKYQDVSPQSLIHSVWYYFSAKLMSIYDPVTGHKYNKIHLDENYWQNKNKYKSIYGVATATIMSEFYFVTLKFNCIKEILYQSNPHSFIPIISYQDMTQKMGIKINIYDEFDEDDIDNWWVSEEYDPYDM